MKSPLLDLPLKGAGLGSAHSGELPRSKAKARPGRRRMPSGREGETFLGEGVEACEGMGGLKAPGSRRMAGGALGRRRRGRLLRRSRGVGPRNPGWGRSTSAVWQQPRARSRGLKTRLWVPNETGLCLDDQTPQSHSVYAVQDSGIFSPFVQTTFHLNAFASLYNPLNTTWKCNDCKLHHLRHNDLP